MREPTAENAPEVGVDVQGQGVVAWQEPDDEFVDRVWVRRLFGAGVGIPIQVSPSSWEGAPLRGPADAFALDVAGFGQTAVAFRQQPGQASKLSAPRSMVNEMPDVFSEAAQKFAGAQLVDGGVRAALGPPSVGVDPRGLYLSGFGEGAVTLLASGDEAAPIGVARLDEGRSGIPGGPLVDLAESRRRRSPFGPSSAATGRPRHRPGAARRRRRRADRAGGAGRGCRRPIWCWAAPASATRSSPGGRGATPTPSSRWRWSTPRPTPSSSCSPAAGSAKPKVRVAWDHSPNAIGGVRYSVSVDDEPVREGLRGLSAVLKADDLDNGRHRIQIFASDDLGQETGSRTGQLLVDRRPPTVKLRRKGRRVTVVG